MKKLLICATALAALTSCVDNELYRYHNPQDDVKDASEYLDFRTTGMVDVSLNYGSLCAGTLVEIFAQDPTLTMTESSSVPTDEALFKAHLDENGRYEAAVELPTACETVYVYANSYAAPQLLRANVENGRLVVETAAPAKALARRTRANADLAVFPVAGSTNMFSLFSGWNEYGNVSGYDANGILAEGSLSANFYSALQYTLWNGATTKPGGLNNRKWAQGSDVVNAVIDKEGLDPETGEMRTIESANLFFTFVGEAAWYENGVGYYYYETGKAPASPAELKKFLILPNASIPYHAPYGEKGTAGNNFTAANAPAYSNMQVQLLYVDDEGNVSTDFPAGLTVGFFLVSDAMQSAKATDKTFTPTNTTFYSNEAWNPNAEKRFIALQSADGSMVFGCEDSKSDFSADDMLFTLSASPNFALKKNPELPVIPEDIVTIQYTTQHSLQTYAFEDIWPNGGDYDLNDVIVEHRRGVTFNQKNFVSEVADTFVAVQPRNSAYCRNAFAVQYAPDLRGTITIPLQSTDEQETHSVVLFPHAEQAMGKTFVIRRQFTNSLSSGVTKALFDSEDINPFIIVDYVAGQPNRTEVHLPKHQATSMADPEQIGSLDDAYYLNKDNRHPFAIKLPIVGWRPVTETVTIGSTNNSYPLYNKWVDSGCTAEKDWYLYKNGK